MAAVKQAKKRSSGPARHTPKSTKSRSAKTASAKGPVAKRTSRKSDALTSAARPIELFFWPTSNGLKIAIMLEECRLPYVIRAVDINKGEQFKPEFLAISPNNRMPAITDPDGPDGKPISLFESGAILQYLGRKTGKFYGQGRGASKIDQWLFWQVGHLGPTLGQLDHFKDYTGGNADYPIERFTKEAYRLYGVMERGLQTSDYLAGRYSIADMASWTWARNYAKRGLDISHFPKVEAWIARVGARPAVARGAKIGEDLRRSA